MMFLNSIATAGLLILSAQSVFVNGVALPDENIQMMNRRDAYMAHSNQILEDHRRNAKAFAEKQHVEKLKYKNKRQTPSYPYWRPSITYPAGNTYGHHGMYASIGCWTGQRKQWAGALVRSITFPNEDGRQYMWWLNRTYIDLLTPGSGVNECFRFGQPTYQYHLASGGDQICTDKIYNPTSRTWAFRDSGNANSYWTANNATYGNQSVRTIWDCHLNQVAVEYRYNHPSIGFKPIRYEWDGARYYRFYDSNNFAWFLMCPPTWLAKRENEGPTPTKRGNELNTRGNLQKRACIFNCNTNNPIWDFLPDELHHKSADNTPLQWYEDGIDWYHETYNKLEEYSTERIFTINYWPPYNYRNITVEGRKCTQLAVSRSGLRHWTVKFSDNPSYGWPAQSQEWSYSSGGWDNIFSESASKSTNAPAAVYYV